MSADFPGKKPLLLVFPYDVMAHYFRCLQLATYFAPFFEIKFLSSKRYQPFITEAGLETFEAASLDAEKVQKCIEAFDFSWLNERELSYIYHEQVKVIEELKPAVVLGDMSPTLRMASEKTRVYYLSLMNGYMSKYYAYVRRMPKTYPLYKLFNLLPTSLFSYFTNIGEHIYFHDIHRPFNKIRRRAGLSIRHSYLQEIEGDLNLICDLPELFPQKQLPENYLFVPPLFHPLHNGSDDAIINKLDRSKKTLLISMGSTGNWQKVVFFNNRKYQKYNIVTAGDQNKTLRGSNVISLPFVNSSELMQAVDLVVCHGGNGTCYQALSCGVPVLSITSNFEQDYNIDGLERCHVARNLSDVLEKDYIGIIDEWIDRKQKDEFNWIKEKIREVKDDFKKNVPDIVCKGLSIHKSRLKI